MLVLGIETATDHSSIALVEAGGELAAWREVTRQDLCRRLAAEAARVLAGAGAGFLDLDLVAVGLGPGSFTSLRVGLATAKAFAFALGKPLVGISSLQAMCWQVRDRLSGLACPMLDARRGEVYAAVCRMSPESLEVAAPEFVATPQALAEKLAQLGGSVTLFGQTDCLTDEQARAFAERRVTVWQEQVVLPDALAVAELGRARVQVTGPDEPARPGIAPLRPIYVRMSYAEEAASIDLGLR